MIIDHKKNTAFELAVAMVDSATPASFKTGLTVVDTAFSKDGAGAWTALAITDTFAEIGTSGIYEISLTAAEMNHDWVVIKYSVSGAADSMVTFRMFATDVDSLVRSTTPANKLDVTATGAAGIDWGNIENQTALVDLDDTRILACTNVQTNSDMRGTDAAALASVATEARLAELDAANLPSDVSAILADTTDMQPKLGTPAADVSADIAAVKGDTAAVLVDTGTTLDTKLDDIQGATFVSGTDSLEAIRDRGDAAWTTGGGGGETQLRTGTAQGGGASTITLDAEASATDDHYKHSICVLTGGTGAKQHQIIDSYVGATKVATMSASWAIAPDATTTFTLLPLGTIPGASAPSAAVVADAVLDELLAEHESAGSMGEAVLQVRANAVNKKIANKATGETTVFKADGVTKFFARTRQQGATLDEVEVVPS